VRRAPPRARRPGDARRRHRAGPRHAALQHATFDLAQRSAERASAKLPRLFTCTSPVALAQLQREIYLDTMDGLFVSGTTLLQLWGQVAQDAVRPLQERARPHH